MSQDDKPDAAKTERPGAIAEQLAFKSRFVLLFGEIDDDSARRTCERLILLAQESTAPIRLLISSPGGHVESGDAIHDMIKFIKPEVYMIGTGWVASAGALIYVSVPKERRLCLPNTRFLLHQPSGGTRGMASDIEIQAREIIKMNERLNKIFADATGQPIEKIAKDTDRDYWLSAKDAIEYGLVSRIVTSQADI